METITKQEWKELHRDYKDIINGQRYILKLENGGTCLVPVQVVKDEEVKNNGNRI